MNLQALPNGCQGFRHETLVLLVVARPREFHLGERQAYCRRLKAQQWHAYPVDCRALKMTIEGGE
jgi:hypothetical protein